MSVRSHEMATSHSKRFVLFASLAAALCIVRFVSDKILSVHLPNRLQDFVTLSTSVIIESLPFVLLGIFLSIVVQTWLPGELMHKLLPNWKPLRRLVISLLGVFLPVCECGNVPLARGLIAKGFSVSESLTFLIAAPILNPITITTTYQAFGGDYSIVIFRILGGLLIANLVGWLFSKHKNPTTLLQDDFIAYCNRPEQDHEHGKITKSFELFRQESNTLMPALFIGAFVAGFIQVVVPREGLLAIGSNPVWSIAAMMVLAFIVSICSNVDAFFALAFRNTFSAGSLVSFLVFGPIIDIKMLSLMRTTYKRSVLLQIALLVGLISALLGLVVNYAF